MIVYHDFPCVSVGLKPFTAISLDVMRGVSPLSDMELDTRFQRLIAERDPEIASQPDKVERLVFCSGKIYYELVAERERQGFEVPGAILRA